MKIMSHPAQSGMKAFSNKFGHLSASLRSIKPSIDRFDGFQIPSSAFGVIKFYHEAESALNIQMQFSELKMRKGKRGMVEQLGLEIFCHLKFYSNSHKVLFLEYNFVLLFVYKPFE